MEKDKQKCQCEYQIEADVADALCANHYHAKFYAKEQMIDIQQVQDDMGRKYTDDQVVHACANILKRGIEAGILT